MHAATSTLKRPRLRAVGLAAAICCIAAGGGAHAQIVTDSSLGMAARTLSGPAYTIPQSLGRLAGTNLFHSFQTFNIGSGESATFTTSTSGIGNVISRVSGGAMSQINGLLRLSAADGAPGFFFINPAGVTFGAGAVIDVPGAFHVGSADHVSFADGRFHADLGQNSSFSSAAPQAFGFLGSHRAPIRVADGAELIQPRGPAVSLTAGDIVIDNASVGAGAGSTRITAVGSQAAEIGFDGALPVVGGNLSLSGGAAVISVARGDSDGASVALHGGRVEIDGDAGVLSIVGAGNAGNGGAIDVVARDALLMSSGGKISSETAGAGNAGAIRIRAGEATFDSAAYLYSSSSPGSSGRSGAIDVVVERGLQLGDGASISTATAGSSSGGGVRLQAGSMKVDSGANVQIDAVSASAPGSLVLDIAGELAMANSARVVSTTSAAADGGLVDLRVGRLTMDSHSFVGSLSLPGASGASGLVDIRVSGDAGLSGGASLLASSASAGNAAPIRLQASNLRLDDASISSNATEQTGAAASGNVELVLSGDLTLANGSLIDTSTLSAGNAGAIVVSARDIALDGDSRIASRALAGSGSAGAVDLVASGRLLLRGESSLSTSTSTAGNAGELRLRANSVLIETGGRINSLAGLDSSGEGGNITITADGELRLRNDAAIGANTAGPGNAGNIRLTAGSVVLDGPAFVSTSTTAGSSGRAGRIEVTSAGDLKLNNRAFISSDTQGGGNAGQVELRAANVMMDSAARISSAAGAGSSGNAGLIDLVASGDVQLVNSSGQLNQSPQISTSTQGSGNGGEIRIRAANLLIDGSGAGVVSFAQNGSSGRAGSITVELGGDLQIRSGGLSSSTDAAGAAGRVQVQANRVLIDGSDSGLTATAGAASAGQAGSVSVEAAQAIELSGGSFVTIANLATVADPAARQPTSVRLIAPSITLRNLAVVSAEASGNVAASDIVIDAQRSLTINRSTVSTSANIGDGGSIRVSTGGLALLRDAVIRTSVFGPAGNGGDIDLTAATLLLDSGFVQANTAASNAAGGLVRISAGALLTSGNSLFLGGDTPYVPAADIFGFNVIQAAAPTGVSGDVQLARPALDVTGSLRELRAAAVDAGGLGRSLCQNTGGSALALAGRGGMPPTAAGLQRAEPAAAMPAVSWADPAAPLASPRVASLGRADGACR